MNCAKKFKIHLLGTNNIILVQEMNLDIMRDSYKAKTSKTELDRLAIKGASLKKEIDELKAHKLKCEEAVKDWASVTDQVLCDLMDQLPKKYK